MSNLKFVLWNMEWLDDLFKPTNKIKPNTAYSHCFFAIQMAAVCRWTLPIRASPTFPGGKRIHDGPSSRAITGREYIGG